MKRVVQSVFVFLGVSLSASNMMGQSNGPAMPDGFDARPPLFTKGLGSFDRAITTKSGMAQRFFDQGIQFMYAFTPEDAARSFREAQRHDPDCGMCYWGEAWAWGPYLNGGMNDDGAPRAFQAAQRALQHISGSSSVERALIEAMAIRYEQGHDRVRRVQLDSAYADALADVYQRFPNDLDVGTLYGESLMLLEPRRGNWDIMNPDVQKIHQILEQVLAADITHPGACHLYIHATESTTRPDKAAACADFLGNSIPGASHINHMPSHTYNRIGRWGESVRANIQAWHSDQKAEIGEGFAIYPSHNLHMLLFAASMDGQGAVAIQAGKDYGRLVNGGSFYHALALVRFGRFDDMLELKDRPTQLVFGGLWDFGRGYALLRNGQTDSAEAYLSRMDDAIEKAETQDAFRGHSAAELLGVTGAILRSEILRTQGKLQDGIRVLTAAVETEDGLRYDEPEPLNFSARHWLGALLLESNQPARAEMVYREALQDHPMNGWSLFGLAQSLRALGRIPEAEQVEEQFTAAWARADVWLRASRF